MSVKKLIQSAAAPTAKALANEVEKLTAELSDARADAAQAQARLSALRTKQRPPARAGKSLTRVVIPDSHGEHIDLTARDVFLADLAEIDPGEIVMLGDHLDCGGTFSAHQRSYTNEMTESYADDVTAANVFLDLIQRAAPRARIYYLEGNHEQHVERWASRNFASHKDAVMALDRLGPEAVLELKRRGISYYRSGEFHHGLSVRGTIRLGKCFFTHGIAHSKHASATHAERFGAPVVHGHTHRSQAYIDRTVTSALTGGFCPGTLAKLQPLYRHTTPTSWSLGYGLQFVTEASGRFVHLNIPIAEGASLLPELTGSLKRKKR